MKLRSVSHRDALGGPWPSRPCGRALGLAAQEGAAVPRGPRREAPAGVGRSPRSGARPVSARGAARWVVASAVGLAAALALVPSRDAGAAAASPERCPADEPAVRVALGRVRQAVASACPCRLEDGAERRRRARAHHLACVRAELDRAVAAGELGEECGRHLFAMLRESVCRRRAGGAAPCVRTRLRDGRVSCRVRPAAACASRRPGFRREACPGFEVCLDAADSNGDGRLDAADSGHCAPSPRFVTDEQGRVVILHGVNVSTDAKREPLRVGWTTEADVRRLAEDWGFDFARLLVFWDAIEPSPGVFDEAYLDRVAERLDWYAAAGILVLLDMHQDVYGSAFGGDGAPPWATRDDGLPFERQSPWWLNYLQPAVLRAFANFWDADGLHADLQEHYAEAWLRLVERFAHHPAVLGYDFMNEPFQGPAAGATFEREGLRPFYERLIARVRAADPDAWILLEPYVVRGNFAQPSLLGAVPDARAGAPRIGFAPHLYDPLVHSGIAYAGDTSYIDAWIAARADEAASEGRPLVIGEFGVEATVAGYRAYLRDVLAAADRLMAGWAYWSYDRNAWGLTFADGSEQEKADDLVRVYPRRIAGDPVGFSYDPEARVFELRFRERPGVTGPTEIYVPAARFYPDGFALSVSDPPGSWSSSWDAAREVLSVTTDPSRDEHRIAIAPAGAGG